jgi:hypothetical protein
MAAVNVKLTLRAQMNSSQEYLIYARKLIQQFRGQHGKAFLFSKVYFPLTKLLSSVNITEGSPEERQMTTGRHVVRDISCVSCKDVVGWKYDRAYEATEQYKEGKFILEHELLGLVK